MSRHRDFPARPDSEVLTDVAVFIVPPELWRENLHSAVSGIDAISAGFLRIHPETIVSSLRDDIDSQLSEDFEIPQSYVFLKNVGKCLTKVRHKQEGVLKVKNFVPPGPSSFVPEIYLLEAGSDTMSLHPSSVSSSFRGEPREDPYQLQSYRGKNTFSSQKPIPPIHAGGDEFPTNQGIPQGKHPLTTSMDSVRSNISQRLYKTNSTNSLTSLISNNSSKALPGINNQNKAVSFQSPIQENEHNARDSLHRTPTPRPNEILDYSTDSEDKSVQFVGFEHKAIQASGSFIMSNQNSDNNNHGNNDSVRMGNHSNQNNNTGYKQNGYRSKTPPPLSATPPVGMSPVPEQRTDGDQPLPPLSATPPIASSPGPGYLDNKPNGYPPPEDSSRWEARDSPVNYHRPNSAELRRQAEEDERRRQEELERQRRAEAEQRRRKEEEDRRKMEEERRRREEDERRRREEDERRKLEDDERRRRENENSTRELEEAERRRILEEEERRRREEEERRRREEEERRRREEEERRRRAEEEERRRRGTEEEERRRREEEERRRRLMEEEERARREEQLKSESRRSGSGDERQKQELLEELNRLRAERQLTEQQREELVKKAKQLQGKTQNRRNLARDVWKKKYFDEKKKTPPLEEQCTKLKQELESIHRRIVNTMEGQKDKDNKRLPPDKPSPQSNVKIQAARLQHEIEDLQRRVETVKMKLTAEMKLRNQAEVELRALRAELTQKKINVTLARSKQQQQNEQELFTARSQPPALSSRT